MLRIYAKPFLDVLDMLGQFSIVGQDERSARKILANTQCLTLSLTKLIAEMQMSEFDMCRTSAERLLDHIERRVGSKQIWHDVIELRGRLLDQIDSVALIAMSRRDKAYFDPSHPLFGAEVEAKFVDMSEDILEAGKCLALDRATAAVFHLMRVMEKALQRLGAELGITLVTEKNWQSILDEVNKAIKALDHKKPRTKAFAEAASHLYAVKLAWRNEVMHPKQTYTPEQAGEIYRNVRAFVRDLAGLI